MSNESSFHIKTVDSNGYRQSILLQNENGPCALVALINVLVLRDSPMAAFVHSRKEQQTINEDELKLKLGEIATQMNSESSKLESLFEFLPRLSNGLDVNPRFDGTFAQSLELGVFESFNIPILHGWVLGDIERAELGIDNPELSKTSYEQFCELHFSKSSDPRLAKFLRTYPSQMTISGLNSLHQSLKEDMPAVLFWNNHFSTVLKHKDKLYALVTDLGFQGKPEIVWEEINTSGAGSFFNCQFRPANEREQLDMALAQQLVEEEKAIEKTKSKYCIYNDNQALIANLPTSGKVGKDVRNAKELSEGSKNVKKSNKSRKSSRCLIM